MRHDDETIRILKRDAELLASELGEGRRGRFHCPDPSHPDENPSAGIYTRKDGAVAAHCHACGFDGDLFDVRAIRNGTSAGEELKRVRGTCMPLATPRIRKRQRAVAKTYDSADKAEAVAAWKVKQDHGPGWSIVNRYQYPGDFVVLRFEPADGSEKTFVPYHRNGDGWKLGDPEGDLPLYHGDDLGDGIVIVVEGEKAADAGRSIGLKVTTSAHGSKSPGKTNWSSLAGRHVAILPDNDKPGADYAETVATILVGLGCKVTIVTLDGLPEGGDLHDWIEERDAQDSQGLRDQVLELIDVAEAWQPRESGEEELAPVADLILAPGDPIPSAREFVSRHYMVNGARTIHNVNDDLYAYNGSVYVPVPLAAIRSKAYAMLDRAKAFDENGKLKKFKPTKHKVNNLIDALRGLVHLDLDTIPAWIDPGDHPDPSELIAVSNGLVHVPSLSLLKPTPGYFNLNATTFDYDPNAPRPKGWLNFLDSIWPNDREAIDTLQELFGLMLTLDTSHEKIFLVVGPKRSGKGTIATVLQALVGAANTCGPTLAGLTAHFGLEGLIGKQLAIVADARLSGRTDQAVIAERLLSISGQDALNVPRKYKADWHGRLGTRCVIMTNELPRLGDASGALASRFVMLTMVNSFYGKEDHGLKERLLGELPGIFNWSLAGLQRLRNRGRFVQPDSSADAILELEGLTSPVAAFVAERCLVDPRQSVLCGDLYDAWKDWCDVNGDEQPGTTATFGRDLRAVVPGLTTSNPTHTVNGRLRFYKGIGLSRG